jgi:hypothetical protein
VGQFSIGVDKSRSDTQQLQRDGVNRGGLEVAQVLGQVMMVTPSEDWMPESAPARPLLTQTSARVTFHGPVAIIVTSIVSPRLGSVT